MRDEPFSRDTLARIRTVLVERGIPLTPVSEAVIATFEQRYRVRLPAGYRALLLTCGSYGLLDLGEVTGDYFGKREVLERLAEPFPLNDVWEAEHEGAGEAEWKAIDRGWMPIIDHGCGGFTMLVCSGPQRGHVWELADVAVGPSEPPSEFLAWYENSLEVPAGDALAELNRLVGLTRSPGYPRLE
jgi:hypothetical protein